MSSDYARRVSSTHGRWVVLFVAPLLLLGGISQAAAPYFTGLNILTPLVGSTVNLRSHGAIAGSAPMRIESVSVLPLGLGVRATVVNGVCVQITNALGIDLLSVGALLSVVVSNPEAPRGVRGTIAVLPGLSSNNNLNTCSDPSSAPVANAGINRSVPDTDAAAGEVVTLNGSASSDPDGTIATYTWTDLSSNQALGNAPVIQPRLADGTHQVRLTVTDNSGASASTTVSIVVQAPTAGGANAPAAPTPNPGISRSLLDTDGLLGELVTLDATASISVAGPIVSYEWLNSQGGLLGTGITLSVRLPDGLNNVTLRVTASNLLTSTATINIAVAAPLVNQLLTSLPNLTPNQQGVAGAVDGLCARLGALADTQTLPAAQVDLLNRCSGLIASVDPAAQVEALEKLGASDFSAIRTQALVFSSNQYGSVMSRLATARSAFATGSRLTNFNLGGSTITIDGKPVPIQSLQMVAKQFWEMFGKDDQSEDDNHGGGKDSLFSDRLGLWVRSNLDRGNKEISPAGDGFEGKQWGLTGGADYRLGERSVLGFAAGYGKSDIDFSTSGRGGLDTKSWTASVYGSAYVLGDLYVDAVLNYGDADYDTTRHILYSEGGTPIDRTALGNTGGRTLSGGLSFGYDWTRAGFTLSPNLGYFRSRAKIDSFDEHGASGLDLAYGNQNYRSSTANATLALNYAWSTPWLVLLPHLRGEYLHEFNDDVEVFGIRFANDPFASASNPTPPVIVRSDVPDQWYWRFAAGLSAQFKHGISGYVEYQQLEDFQFVNFHNLTLGLRFQRAIQ